jgi:sugar/nucleoside kinase (ribokinase family)
LDKKQFDVIVVGEINIDLVLWKVPMPENEQEKLAEDMRFTMGSSSAITAHNLAAIGARVAFVGKAGDDNFGHFMADQLAAAGVDTSHIIMDPALKTGATIVLANPPQKALLTYLGAMRNLTLQDIDWDFIAIGRHLHLGCFFLQTGIRGEVWKLFQQAKSLGLTTSLDTNWDPEEKWGDDLWQALAWTDLFFPNDDEALRIAGTADLQEAIRRLGGRVGTLAIKRGSAGALACRGEEQIAAPPYRVEAVETTGAGDSFNAGFIHHFLEGRSLAESLAFGNACGALAVTEMGGTAAFRNPGQVRVKLGQIMHG